MCSNAEMVEKFRGVVDGGNLDSFNDDCCGVGGTATCSCKSSSASCPIPKSEIILDPRRFCDIIPGCDIRNCDGSNGAVLSSSSIPNAPSPSSPYIPSTPNDKSDMPPALLLLLSNPPGFS